MDNKKRPILHVLVVGFHHKKGCQVEYSYPRMLEGGPPDVHDTPPGWKYLPTLALPDGSHNYDKDTVFFHLPSLDNPDETVFGISCFRQIPVEKLKNKTADITRGTVQKAVCVLSTMPLYGHIQVKMELITHAYFEEGDFTKVSLLEDTYCHLNSCLEQVDGLRTSPQLFVGLSARDLVLTLRQKVVLLYKLLLLEKKVVFFQSPVHPLCTSVLSLLSLHPGMIEKGLDQAACFKPSRPMSPVPQFVNSAPDSDAVVNSYESSQDNQMEPCDRVNGIETFDDDVGDSVETAEDGGERSVRADDGGDRSVTMSRDGSVDFTTVGDSTYQNALATLAQFNVEECGLPLTIFTNGYLCLPYLSLPYLDVLSDSNIRGYILGATNVLFKQKKKIADVIVELDTGLIEVTDVELKRMLHLSTEDLRFGEFLDRRTRLSEDVYTDGVGWEGGDEWVRSQFHAYTLALLRTSLLPDGSKEHEQFNKWYMSALIETESYQRWKANPLSKNILEVNPGHPFVGQLSVADMKLRLAHTMQTTEGGRKLNQAMVSTGRAVATTGKAVGGAISQAKGALTNWWSNLTTPPQGGSLNSTVTVTYDGEVEFGTAAVEEEPAKHQDGSEEFGEGSDMICEQLPAPAHQGS